ncbi:MAG: hypothetical protein AAF591_12675 [Verrucomicrobiota bacterium]
MSSSSSSSPESKRAGESPGWFDRPTNVRKVLLGLYGACALFVVIDVVFRVVGFDKHPYFEWERWPGFQAVYGFVACVLLVFVAKYVLRPLVMRKEDYYEPVEDEEAVETSKGGGDDHA